MKKNQDFVVVRHTLCKISARLTFHSGTQPIVKVTAVRKKIIYTCACANLIPSLGLGDNYNPVSIICKLESIIYIYIRLLNRRLSCRLQLHTLGSALYTVIAARASLRVIGSPHEGSLRELNLYYVLIFAPHSRDAARIAAACEKVSCSRKRSVSLRAES